MHIIALRVDVLAFESPFRIIFEPYWPKKAFKYKWIPVPIGQQIWILFMFDTLEDKDLWIVSLPSYLRRLHDNKLVKIAEKYPWELNT